MPYIIHIEGNIEGNLAALALYWYARNDLGTGIAHAISHSCDELEFSDTRASAVKLTKPTSGPSLSTVPVRLSHRFGSRRALSHRFGSNRKASTPVTLSKHIPPGIPTRRTGCKQSLTSVDSGGYSPMCLMRYRLPMVWNYDCSITGRSMASRSFGLGMIDIAENRFCAIWKSIH
jgi:hypothetical protein